MSEKVINQKDCMPNLNQPDYANLGTYIQTSFNLDVQKLRDMDVNSAGFKEMLVRLYQDLNKISLALNDKLSGFFPQAEFATGGKYFPVTQITVGATDGAGSFGPSVIAAFAPPPYSLGQSFTIGVSTFVLNVFGTPAALTRISGIGSGTFDTTTGSLTLTGTTASTSIVFSVGNSSTNPINYRQEFVMPIDFGALPNGSASGGVTKSVAHNITFDVNTTFVHIYATATSPTTLEALPIIYAFPGASGHENDTIALWVDGTNVNIHTNEDYSRYQRVVVILKYLKN